ncbi:ATPase/histidine kinase/DNA gyrase B/HSP90 domain protein [Ostertagia ostertagi]
MRFFMVYPLRNLMISFAVIIIVVLLIVLRTFSALRSQEKEQERIRQSRDALQVLGPANTNIREFEALADNYYNTGDSELLRKSMLMKSLLEQDSVRIGRLVRESAPGDKSSYTELAAISHQTRRKTEARLTQFNAELERQVEEKTTAIRESELQFRTLFKSLAVSEKNLRYEQINNILKHADASEITILVNAGERLVKVEIIDNGKGFDPASKRKGIGISNMINRVESFNGEIKIVSSPGHGCKVDIAIPC